MPGELARMASISRIDGIFWTCALKKRGQIFTRVGILVNLSMGLIGPISYPGECDLTVHPTKVQRHFLTNAFRYFGMYITCTKIQNRPD